MERILREFFEASGRELEGGYTANILADVFETPDEIRISAELPGFAKGDLVVEVMRDAIVIEAVKREERPGEKVNYLCMERGYGKFRRLIELPVACDTRRIRARYAKGILIITVPRVAERRGERRTVEITLGDEG
jgi:HSP20 family protein